MDTINNLRRALMETHIVEGHLICPGSATRFRVSDGVPDFVNVFTDSSQAAKVRA